MPAEQVKPLEDILVAIPAASRASRAFACPKCPHRAPDALWPPLPVHDHEELQEQERQRLTQSTDEENEEAPLVCFHSRQTWRQDVLGFGLTVQFRSNRVDDVTMLMDYVGWTSFTGGLRQGLLSGTTFTHWLPLFINEEHAVRAFPLLARQVCALYHAQSFHPEMAFELLCKMMNSFIVAVWKGHLHLSEHALDGYCYMHRWLLHLAECYPVSLRFKEVRCAGFPRGMLSQRTGRSWWASSSPAPSAA